MQSSSFAAVPRPRRWRANRAPRAGCGSRAAAAQQHLNRSRYYDAGYGRFTSADSYRGKELTPPSLHRYAYALNNPVRFRDPNGRAVWNCQYLAILVSTPNFAGGLGGGIVIWLCDGQDSLGGRLKAEVWSFVAGLAWGKLPLAVTQSSIQVQDNQDRTVNLSLLEGPTIYISISGVLGFGIRWSHVGFGLIFPPGEFPGETNPQSLTSGSTGTAPSSLLTTGFDIGLTLMGGYSVAF